jgi:hypothetical protein
MQEHTAQVWLVFLMGAAQKAGLLPISKRLFHRIIFLSNCLAPLFSAAPAAATIVKYRRGPFYPKLQWYLDRLAVLGILKVRDVEYLTDEHGVWMEANYFTNGTTRHVIDTCTQINYGRQIEEYLTEMVFAVASTSQRTWESAALHDSTYGEAGKSEGAFIDFTDPSSNLSVQTARAFQAVLPKGIVVSPREEMFLYLRFLEAQVAKVGA